MKKQERIVIISLAGFLITYFCYHIAYGVAQPAKGIPPENTTTLGPFLNLSNTTWNMYNESSGSTRTIHFGNDNTYTRMLHDNNLTGMWSSNVVTAQLLQLCPSEEKWTSSCLLALLRTENPNIYGLASQHNSSYARWKIEDINEYEILMQGGTLTYHPRLLLSVTVILGLALSTINQIAYGLDISNELIVSGSTPTHLEQGTCFNAFSLIHSRID